MTPAFHHELLSASPSTRSPSWPCRPQGHCAGQRFDRASICGVLAELLSDVHRRLDDLLRHPDNGKMERAAHALRGNGHAIDEALLRYLSPLGWEHINLTSDYA